MLLFLFFFYFKPFLKKKKMYKINILTDITITTIIYVPVISKCITTIFFLQGKIQNGLQDLLGARKIHTKFKHLYEMDIVAGLGF